MLSPNLERLGLVKRLTFAVAISVAGAACDLNVTVTGVVKDPSGSAIQDVAVELETAGRAPHRAKTASNGSFHVGIVGADPRSTNISFRKDGYQDVRRVLGTDARPTINVTLVPIHVQ